MERQQRMTTILTQSIKLTHIPHQGIEGVAFDFQDLVQVSEVMKSLFVQELYHAYLSHFFVHTFAL